MLISRFIALLVQISSRDQGLLRRSGKRFSKRRIALVVSGSMICAGLWGCAPDTSSDGPILRVGIQLEPPNLDPTAGAAGATDAIVYNNIAEGLVRMQADGTIVPGLATHWHCNDRGLLCDFTLRRGVTFHDGALFDASDVKFTFDRAAGPNSTNVQQAVFRKIARTEIISSHKVRLHLKTPFPTLLTFLAWGDAVIVDPASAAQNASHPVGTGPFSFVRWQRSTRITLARNDKYWGEKPAFARVDFMFIPDPSVADIALRAGDIDAFAGYPAPENIDQFRKNDAFKVLDGISEGETILAINHRHPILKNQQARIGLTQSIDKKALIKGAMFGHAQPIFSHFPPGRPDTAKLGSLYPFNPAKGRALIEETGLIAATRKDPLRLKLPPPSYARRSGEIIAAQLRDAGIEVRMENLEWAQWIDQVFLRHDFDLTIVSHTEPMDLDIYTRPNYYFGFNNSHYSRIIDDLHLEQDPEKRRDMVIAAQTILAQQAVNVFLFQLPSLTVHDARLTGFWTNAPLQANVITDVRPAGMGFTSTHTDK